METLISAIKKIQKKTSVQVKQRLKEFDKIHAKDETEWFHELCFCILAANTSSKMASKITEAISSKEFLSLSLEDLKKRMKEESCRFYNKRAEYIVCARKFKNIKKELSQFPNSFEKRDFLAEHVKGIGYKEASHFLRNTGHYDVAILDKHIKNILKEYGLISEKLALGNLSPKKYLELEEILEKISDILKISQGELDFYIWYMKTGEILK